MWKSKTFSAYALGEQLHWTGTWGCGSNKLFKHTALAGASFKSNCLRPQKTMYSGGAAAALAPSPLIAYKWLQATLLFGRFPSSLTELKSKAAWSRPRSSLIFSQPYSSPYLSITWKEERGVGGGEFLQCLLCRG